MEVGEGACFVYVYNGKSRIGAVAFTHVPFHVHAIVVCSARIFLFVIFAVSTQLKNMQKSTPHKIQQLYIGYNLSGNIIK